MNEAFSHPEWSYNSNIYEVNVRQYTSEGTFASFEQHLPRLKDMGIEILWFMPVTPISMKDRLGSMGSYYAAQNYQAINPEFGTLEDFKNLVEHAQEMGFKIIIDWVANHTGNDHIWIDQHPDYFVYDSVSKELIHPHGWTDVSQLNYDNQQMQDAMIDAMKFWITSCNIDGFRCDMAHLVPLGFWLLARKELEKVKPSLFWLAECEEASYHEVFDASYTWNWMHKTEAFYKQQASLHDLHTLLHSYNLDFPADAFRVYYTSNHDENSWNGTEYEKYGSAVKVLNVFSFTWNGIPMIYSGQELPNKKRLKFFDKDCIDWVPGLELHEFYKTLISLRKRNQALRAGDEDASTIMISTKYPDKIFAFSRQNKEEEVMVFLNLSADELEIELDAVIANFIDVFSGQPWQSIHQKTLVLPPWDYKILEKNP
ncbi:MAG: alpha-amylase family glycosyl hydrolase [Ginsengibacter sp.]